MSSDAGLLDPPLDLLFEGPALPRFDLPESLTAAYAGSLGFGAPRLFANFVSSVDGVVALPDGGESGHIISQGSLADRFVMGLLRACADAVIVGAGTFRKSPGQLWYPEAIYPPAAAAFAEARTRRGLPPKPAFVLVTGSGAVDATEPALRDAIVATTAAGAERLRAQLPPTTRLLVLDASPIRLTELVARLHSEGLYVLLTEGGPSLVAELVAGALLDELFLTLSPSLFGRWEGDRRKSLANGVDLAGTTMDLLSVRRHGSHAFLRYAVRPPAPVGPQTHNLAIACE